MRRVYYKYSAEKDIIERAKKFTVDIIELINHLPRQTAVFCIGKQIIDSAGSIGANLVEARISHSKRDFIKSARISLKEANETLYWLDILNKSGIISKDRYDKLATEGEQITKIIAAIIRNLSAQM